MYKEEELYIPDEAIQYIVSRYLTNRNSDGLPLTSGINPDAVESVLELFVEWAGKNGYVKDGQLVIGNK